MTDAKQDLVQVLANIHMASNTMVNVCLLPISIMQLLNKDSESCLEWRGLYRTTRRKLLRHTPIIKLMYANTTPYIVPKTRTFWQRLFHRSVN